MGSVMGSLALAYHDAREFRMETKRKAEHEVNLLRPLALLHWDGGDGEQPPPLDERRRIVQRWIEYEKRKGPRRFEYLPGLVQPKSLSPLIRYCTSLCSFSLFVLINHVKRSVEIYHVCERKKIGNCKIVLYVNDLKKSSKISNAQLSCTILII